MENKGLIHVFCGTGRGKTSAAVGCAVRAAGHGRMVTIVQFLKGRDRGDYSLLSEFEPEIKLFSFEKSSESFKDLNDEARKEELQNIMNGINFAKKVLATGECDLLVLDEFLGLVDTGIISQEEFADIISSGSGEMEIIITGINAGDRIRELADDVTEFVTTGSPAGKERR